MTTGDDEKLRLVGDYFPNWDRFVRRSGLDQDGSRYLQEARNVLSELPKWAVERACKELMKIQMTAKVIPFRVAEKAKVIAEQYAEWRWKRVAPGLQVVRCPICEDEGVLVVLDPLTLEECKKKGTSPQMPYCSVVACSCETGGRIAERWAKGGIRVIRYNASRHIVADRVYGVDRQYSEALGIEKAQVEGGNFDGGRDTGQEEAELPNESGFADSPWDS